MTTDPDVKSDAERAEQMLHVAGLVIEKMKAAVPCGTRWSTHWMEKVQTLSLTREHDQMVTCLIVALQPFVRPLRLDIEPASTCLRLLTCTWPGEKETPKCGNAETEAR